jgi:hypothetical protein
LAGHSSDFLTGHSSDFWQDTPLTSWQDTPLTSWQDTPLFLFHAEFYSPLSSLFPHKHFKTRDTSLRPDWSDGIFFAYDAADPSLIPTEVSFLNHHDCNGWLRNP